MYHIDGQKLMYKFGDGATESHDDTVTDNLEEAKMDAAWWNEYIEFDGLNRLFFFLWLHTQTIGLKYYFDNGVNAVNRGSSSSPLQGLS